MAPLMFKRLWVGSSLAFALATLGSWNYGAMFAPLLVVVLLSKMQQWNSRPPIQLILAMVATCVIGNLILGFLQPYPLLMAAAVALWMAINCITMTHPGTFMFGFVNLAVGSILVNVGSFDGFDRTDFSLDLIFSAVIAAATAAMMLLLFPSGETPGAAAPDPMPAKQMQHTLKLCWWLVMLLFLAFQILDLADTLSAQAAAVLLLVPMGLSGSLVAARARLVGTVLGCSAALALQLLLFSYLDYLGLYLLGFTLAVGPFLLWVCQGGERSAVGFAATSALVVLLSGVIPEQQDLFFASLYRFSSTLALVLITALLLVLMHHWFPQK